MQRGCIHLFIYPIGAEQRNKYATKSNSSCNADCKNREVIASCMTPWLQVHIEEYFHFSHSPKGVVQKAETVSTKYPCLSQPKCNSRYSLFPLGYWR